MKWQVGLLTDFADSDPEFDSKQEAFDDAYRKSEEDYESFYAVWTGQEDGSELIAIAHNGELFRRDFSDFGVEITLSAFIHQGDDGEVE